MDDTPFLPSVDSAPSILPQSHWMPGHTTSASYSYVEPSVHVTELLSGSKDAAAFLIQVAFLGITDCSERSEVEALAWPPPTSVHSGW